MNELSGGAVILAVLLYMAKSVYELIKRSKSENGKESSPTVNSNGSVFDIDVQRAIYETRASAESTAKLQEKVEDKMTQMVNKQEITNMKLDQFLDLLKDLVRR